MENESKDYWRGYLHALRQALAAQASTEQKISTEITRIKKYLTKEDCDK